ncbi:hypothetical protein [Pigmentiphaga sp.]|uniref:hypothetical protein n=1 Tax=Pigmentiphaga sp. TaxID=1977564 RepID=UPI0025D8D5FC|nr:hypothetical protein [Pigmentiphaga sp.]
MRIPPTTRETRHTAQAHLRAAVHPLRPDIPARAITIETDERGLWSAQIFGVEQALQSPGESLYLEVMDRLSHWHPIYEHEEISALLTTLKIIAPKAGLAIPPGALKLIELPAGVLVLTLNDLPVVASEDPLHLLSQAVVSLRAAQAAAR